MNDLILFAAAAPEGNRVEEIARTFGWHPQMFLSQLIAFIIVAFALKKWAFGPLLAMLEERKNRIAESMENAEKIKKELASAEQERKRILAEAGVQANKAIEEAKAAAAKVQDQKIQEAIQQANQIIAKAQEAAVADRDRLMSDLKREIGHLAVKAAMQVTGKVLTDADQQRLAEETNRELAA